MPPGTFAIGGGIGGGRSKKHLKPAAPARKPLKTTTDPQTGLPRMPTAQELRAEANAQTWKSIQSMQQALPDEASLSARYGAQRNAIVPLIAAHRDWLIKAGQYQVNQSNALSQMVQSTASEADQTQTGVAGLGGIPAGTAAPSTNVSPANAAMPVAAYGTSFANYLHSLVPYADAIGGNALGRVNQAENEELGSVRDAKSKVALQYGDIYDKNVSSLTTNALNEYKGELAALVARGKDTTGAAKTAETQRHNLELERAARDRNLISSRRADSAIELNKSKLTNGTSGTATPAQTKSLKSSLAKAYEIYNETGGTKQPTWFSVRLTYNPPKLPSGQPGPSKDAKVIGGATRAEVLKKLQAFMVDANNQPQTGPIPNGRWSQDGAIAAPPNTPTKTVGKKGEANRRLAAWRYLVQQNPEIDQATLRAMFRAGVGAPPGSKK